MFKKEARAKRLEPRHFVFRIFLNLPAGLTLELALELVFYGRKNL